MVPTKTRKLSDFNPESDVHESSARPRLQPPLTTDQDPPLTLYLFVQRPPEQPQPPPQLPPPPPDHDTTLTIYLKLNEPPPQIPPPPPDNSVNPRRNRRKQPQTQQQPPHAPRPGKSPVIQPPFPWATDRRAKVHTLNHLTQTLFIKTITGDVVCKRCQKPNQIEYDLEQKFKEVCEFIETHKNSFYDRAPMEWMNPLLPTCSFCNQENSLKPVVKKKKKSINWLFLFLGQMLGCCTLDQLKWFCKHTGNHRTGAKDRVLYLTYIELCKQVKSDR